MWPREFAVGHVPVGSATGIDPFGDAQRLFLRRHAGRVLMDRSAKSRGVIAAPVAPRPAGAVLFHASNFRPVKRPVDLIRIFARVRKQLKATLVLAGDGPERARVEEEVKSRGLGDDVRFAGTPSDLLPLLRAADLFLLPSASEMVCAHS